MKQWMTATVIAFVFVSCDEGNKIYTGPSDKNTSSLSNKISVAETFTMTVIRSSSAAACAKDSNTDVAVIPNKTEILGKCNGLLKTAGHHF